MNKTLSLVFFSLLTLLTTNAMADEWLKTMKDFELTDHMGVTHALDEYADNEFIVMYVHGSGCPIARLSVPTFLGIRDDYADSNITFLMLNSFIQDDIPRIRKEAADFNIDFPILKDADQSVARSLGVERTAEVFIVDPRTRKVVFRGPIDDSLGYETQRINTEHNYLRDALDAVMAGETINMNDIPDSKGCLVGFFLS
ncbi:redoxin domain-containing protein [Pseudohongiella sp.]|uniref:Thioredoxin domain-containing protein n=1 Tax=marine sediment metagenome TaxID=412755 RepID=A0A0F9Z6G5_9ZZZZ|nr:redoxin domain-containing protein [Pseudohongiella sp.]HDZ09535.1 redoxin domain-containing protein [Pseudohongiella sp.]HEA63493.1 redoxin domain-containing protein [Pseudohongiella sp.]